MEKKFFALVAAGTLAVAAPSSHAAIVFDFSSAATTNYTSLTQTTDGLTLTLQREAGASFFVLDIDAPFGNALTPFLDTTNTAFIGNFSSPQSTVSIDFGDFAPSDADIMLLQIFSGLNATGTLLDSASIACCEVGSGFVGGTLTLTGTGINSIRFIGGSLEFPNSLFYDNITVSANSVPEPGSLALFSLGLVGASIARRYRK